MSFCIKPNTCKKCGKPLTLFEGWYCLECEKAEQEPKTGHWIKENPPMVERYPFCSECGFVNPFENPLNYCPNCGCRMVEPQESEG